MNRRDTEPAPSKNGSRPPLSATAFVPTEAALAAFAGAPRVDSKRLRRDLDRVVDQDPTPRD